MFAMMIDLLEELEPYEFQHSLTIRVIPPLEASLQKEIDAKLDKLDQENESLDREGVIVVVTPDFNFYMIETSMEDASEFFEEFSSYQEFVLLLGSMPSDLIDEIE